ncbi:MULTISPECIES: hypothetical protein [Streptomyces]|uniref:Uncharacterized protein n=1 Tax=Streptomyces muensis TaxID=1077944 RepID=A0A9X1PRZ8_STRM4|nr:MULTISPECIES: hypothetical protein [Streptomyces]MCF1592427.1 hypothetical protein [Streptomyces muensis]QKV98186.1 hypothetical protein HUT19_41430 [Streptomyces sp. NA02950]
MIRQPSPEAAVIPLRPVASAGGDGRPTDLQVAAWWEKIFGDMGRTLTDPATAEAHRITAAGFGLLIDGARAAGVLSDSQATYLSGLAVEAVRAPDFVGDSPSGR